MLVFKGNFILSRPLFSYLVFACRPFSIQLLVCAHLVHSSSSKLSSVVMYLMLLDGGFLNYLLPSDSIPSNSDHLFWSMALESIEFLETCIHQCQVLSPSTVLGIHQCPLIDGLSQGFDLNTSIHTCLIALCTLIPILIIVGMSRFC